MQSGPTTRLAKKLRKTHEMTRSWPKTAAAHNIVTVDGRPDPAMAWKIALRDYEPKDPDTRRRYGLPAVCPNCHRREPRGHSVPGWVSTGADFLQAQLDKRLNK